MIDTHCHILPGLDDGPRTMEGAMRMAAVAVDHGIHTIVATPHHGTRSYTNIAAKIRQEVKKLNARLRAHGIQLQVLPGQEYRLNEDYQMEHQQGRLQTLADSSYLLVELPSKRIPTYFLDFVHYMETQHTKIIIAHPERNVDIMNNPEQLYRWIERGILLQVTSQSLIGLFSKKIQKTAMFICKKNWAHFLATDAHNTVQRGFCLRDGLGLIERYCGSDYKQCLHKNTLQLILKETVMPSIKPKSGKRL